MKKLIYITEWFLLLVFCVLLMLAFGKMAYAQTYVQGNNLIEVPTTTATAAGTTTLTATARKLQQFTGATTQTVVLPAATALQKGRSFYFTNRSTGTITIQYNDTSTALTLVGGNQAYFILENNGSANGTWDIGASQAPLSFGNLTDAGTDGITVTNGTGAVIGSGTSLVQHVADTTHNGYLLSTDWNTFNGKQAAGNYVTALTGDVTASGPGSVAATLATVNANVGSFGSSTSIPSLTVNGKGLVTAASGNAVIAPAGTLTGTTLNSTVVSSSLTSLGTIATGVWNGTTIAIANGGTGQTTASAAFNALSPITTQGDLIVGTGTNTAGRIALGANNTLLQSNGTTVTYAKASLVNNITGTLGVGNGGTGATTLTIHGVVIGNTTSAVNITAAGAANSVLTGNGAADPTFQTIPGSGLVKAPTVTRLTSTGTTSGYYFTVTSANATAGATYTNNGGNTFTVVNTIAAQTTLFTSGASAPTASGTLTKSGGTGDATITFSSSTAMATYTPPTGPAPLYLKVRMVGGGSGGVGGGTSAGTVPTPGGGTVFSGGGVVLNGGGIGVWNTSVGTGGTVVTVGSAIGVSIAGANGNGWHNSGATNLDSFAGGAGASAPYFSGAGPSTEAAAGGNAVANSGAGGGGGAASAGTANTAGGSGGASGAFADVIISPVPATIYYAIGAGGSGGGAGGGSGFAGGNGAAGQIYIEEDYQ